MKKSQSNYLFVFVITLLLTFSFVYSINLAHAQETAPGLEGLSQNDSTLQAVQAGQQQYEQYTTAENKSAYLTEQWGILIGKSQYIGPIHNFLSSHETIFIILFNYPYEISFTFFFVLFIWIVFWSQSSKIIKSAEILKGNLSLIAGLLFTILFAQIRVFNFIAKSITNLMFSSDAWWIRLIAFIIACSLIITLAILSNYLSKYFKTQKEKERLAKLEQSASKFESFEKGVEEGQKLVG